IPHFLFTWLVVAFANEIRIVSPELCLTQRSELAHAAIHFAHPVARRDPRLRQGFADDGGLAYVLHHLIDQGLRRRRENDALEERLLLPFEPFDEVLVVVHIEP